jgi:hypothetical protein
MPISEPMGERDTLSASLALRWEMMRVDSHVESVITKTKRSYNFVLGCVIRSSRTPFRKCGAGA